MSRRKQRFMVVDLGTQIDSKRRFAVWDTTVSKFWKINSNQTWACIDDLVDDFAIKIPGLKFKDTHLTQRDKIVELAFSMGFDREGDA